MSANDITRWRVRYTLLPEVQQDAPRVTIEGRTVMFKEWNSRSIYKIREKNNTTFRPILGVTQAIIERATVF